MKMWVQFNVMPRMKERERERETCELELGHYRYCLSVSKADPKPTHLNNDEASKQKAVNSKSE